MNNDCYDFMLFPSLMVPSNYLSDMFIDYDDKEINDCIFYMNIFLLTEEDDAKYEERYQKYLDCYTKLSDEKKLIIEEYLNKLKKTREEKIKKKGNDKL